ncbi:MAG: hypothetical protein F6K24_30370 [Okeania sp. SIO2D1]|nr:hypothetical protein [Okeania sp. SIO2D1]
MPGLFLTRSLFLLEEGRGKKAEGRRQKAEGRRQKRRTEKVYGDSIVNRRRKREEGRRLINEEQNFCF